jgi:hypothetical protein
MVGEVACHLALKKIKISKELVIVQVRRRRAHSSADETKFEPEIMPAKGYPPSLGKTR